MGCVERAPRQPPGGGRHQHRLAAPEGPPVGATLALQRSRSLGDEPDREPPEFRKDQRPSDSIPIESQNKNSG